MTERPPSSYPPPWPPGPAAPSVPGGAVRPRGLPMAVRHLLSVAVAMVLTPVGLVLVDVATQRYYLRQVQQAEGGTTAEVLVMLLGLAVLWAVASVARISGLGPLLAGLLWAGVPFLWALVDMRSFWEATRELPDVWGRRFWFSSPFLLFGLTAAGFVGAGVAGRWRRTE